MTLKVICGIGIKFPQNGFWYHEIRGFRNLYQQLDNKVRLSGQSASTLHCYDRKLAQLSLHFGKLLQYISEKELNKYLASLVRQSESLSLSNFKFTMYGLRYCCRLLGMKYKVVQLPKIKRSNKLSLVQGYCFGIQNSLSQFQNKFFKDPCILMPSSESVSR